MSGFLFFPFVLPGLYVDERKLILVFSLRSKRRAEYGLITRLGGEDGDGFFFFLFSFFPRDNAECNMISFCLCIDDPGALLPVARVDSIVVGVSLSSGPQGNISPVPVFDLPLFQRSS